MSMVMPEAGLLAVVAMALAATEAKKKANSSVSARPQAEDGPRNMEMPEEDGDGKRAERRCRAEW